MAAKRKERGIALKLRRVFVFLALLALMISLAGVTTTRASAPPTSSAPIPQEVPPQDSVDPAVGAYNNVLYLQQDLLRHVETLRQATLQSIGQEDAVAANPLAQLNSVIFSLDILISMTNTPSAFEIPPSHPDYETISTAVAYALRQLRQGAHVVKYQAKILMANPADVYQNPADHFLLYQTALGYCEAVAFAMWAAGQLAYLQQ